MIKRVYGRTLDAVILSPLACVAFRHFGGPKACQLTRWALRTAPLWPMQRDGPCLLTRNCKVTNGLFIASWRTILSSPSNQIWAIWTRLVWETSFLEFSFITSSVEPHACTSLVWVTPPMHAYRVPSTCSLWRASTCFVAPNFILTFLCYCRLSIVWKRVFLFLLKIWMRILMPCWNL